MSTADYITNGRTPKALSPDELIVEARWLIEQGQTPVPWVVKPDGEDFYKGPPDGFPFKNFFQNRPKTVTPDLAGWWEDIAATAIAYIPSGMILLDIEPSAGAELIDVTDRRATELGYRLHSSARGGRHIHFFAYGLKGKYIVRAKKPDQEGKFGIRIDTERKVAEVFGEPEVTTAVTWLSPYHHVLAEGELPSVDDLTAFLRELWPGYEIQIEPAPGTARASTIKTGKDKTLPSSNKEPIVEGERHNRLVGIAGAMRRQGCGPESIEAALHIENEERCRDKDGKPKPLPEKNIHEIAVSVPRLYPPGQNGTQNSIPLAYRQGSAGESNSWVPVPITDGGADTKVDWIWGEGERGFIARGEITDWYGLWKAGKTTMIAALLTSLGMTLAGMPVADVPQLVITEESPRRWARRAKELGISPERVHRISRPFRRRPVWDEWESFVEHVASLIEQNHYGLIIVDALPNLWPVFNENDAGEVLRALQPLQTWAEAGAAVLLVRHPRKSDGTEATAGRGSGAIGGFVDIICEFRRYRPENEKDKRRVLKVYSREEPFELVVEWRGGAEYIAIGTKAEVGRDERLQALLAALPKQPPGSTTEEILEGWKSTEVPVPQPKTLQQWLREAVNKGAALRIGEGVKGDPYRYYANPEYKRVEMEGTPGFKGVDVGDVP
jgi:hypothetical protein